MIEIRCSGRDALTTEEARTVAEAARAGGVILLPTDTLYGLGADPFSPSGLAAVFRLKGRSPGKQLPVLIADGSLLGRFVSAVPPGWEKLMARFWPGPLTMLFPALPGLLPGIRSPAGKVALRVPGSALCRSVLAAAGGALTGTSANPAGAGGTGDPGEALRGIAGTVDVLVNAGTLPLSPVSTLIDMDAEGKVTVIREGAVAFEEILRAETPPLPLCQRGKRAGGAAEGPLPAGENPGIPPFGKGGRGV